jgi:APA family basic amino acid/polyamine antiporter
MEKVSEEGLVREIRQWGLVGIVMNSMIGSGIFVLPAKAFGLIGNYSLLAFLLCAVVIFLIILCFAEVSSRFSGTGGAYLFAREAFGSAVGFEVGWIWWLARVGAYATNCNLLVVYLALFWPAAGAGFRRAAVIIVVTTTLTFINYIGVRNATMTSNVFILVKLLPIVLFIALGLFVLTPSNFTLGAYPTLGSFSTTVLLLIYAFSGFENAGVTAGEVVNPRRTMALAFLIAIAIVAAIYILIQVVCIGTLPGLGSTERPLADAASRFLGPWGASLIALGIIASVLGNLNVSLLTNPRILFAMSGRKELPALFGAVHPRFHTPHVATLVTGAFALLLTLSSSLIYALTVSTIARLIVYIVTCMALPTLRRKRNAPPAMMKVAGGSIISVIAVVVSLWLLTNSTAREARDSIIAAVAGLVIYFSYRLYSRRRV